MEMKHGKENHQMGEKERAKDLRVIKTSCKDVFRAPERSSGQPSSRKRNQMGRDLEEATGVIRERKAYAERQWHCSPQTHHRSKKPDQEKKGESVL